MPNTILAKQTTLDDLLCKIPGIQKRGEDIEVRLVDEQQQLIAVLTSSGYRKSEELNIDELE